MKVICENYQECTSPKVVYCVHKEWHEADLGDCNTVPCIREGGIEGSLCVENIFITIMKKTIKEECAV